MSFFDKIFGKKKEDKKADKDNLSTTFSATTMNLNDLNNLKVGDTIQLGNNNHTDNYDLKWISADESPFGIKVFDCREFAMKMISTTKNEEIVKSFFSTRQSDGKEYIGKFPENGAKIEVDLNFYLKNNPEFKHGIPDGILAKAQTMEQKWDIYKYANFIFYVRSWTGELVYFSNYIPTNDGFKIDLIVLDDSKIKDDDPYFELKVVEFLVHSHILNLQVPHPIPKSLEDEPDKIATFSFSMFGNRGYYATYE